MTHHSNIEHDNQRIPSPQVAWISISSSLALLSTQENDLAGIEQSENLYFKLRSLEYEWRPDEGLWILAGVPALALWVESTLAGLMQGMQRMVGTERFNLALQGGGRDSVADDWAVISAASTFEQGFADLGEIAVLCGWGTWTMVSLDRDKREAVIRVKNNWEAMYQKSIGACWGTTMTAGKFAGFCTRLFGTNCWATQTRFQARDDEYDEFVVKPSDVSLEEQHAKLLESDNATRAELAVALEKLRQEMAERQLVEQERLRLIEALSAPILQVWDGVLALPVLGSLSGDRAATLMDSLLGEIQRTQSRYAILDVTGVDVIDTHTADHLLKVARAVELLGARCIITGIQPAVAQTMVNLQASFSDIITCATLRDGIKYCMKRRQA